MCKFVALLSCITPGKLDIHITFVTVFHDYVDQPRFRHIDFGETTITSKVIKRRFSVDFT